MSADPDAAQADLNGPFPHEIRFSEVEPRKKEKERKKDQEKRQFSGGIPVHASALPAPIIRIDEPATRLNHVVFKRQRQKFPRRGAPIPANEAYGEYAEMREDEVQRSAWTVYEAVRIYTWK